MWPMNSMVFITLLSQEKDSGKKFNFEVKKFLALKLFGYNIPKIVLLFNKAFTDRLSMIFNFVVG